ncbi:zinc-dependent metalloprotease [Piscicoccus intestinalis]|uniref:zinc-dependent metalloprotease n=1 Tax=Piscicoccus intestinalis TaxID=746033 RepID=UPI000A067630|nr:zinc-dependent metalloprotease [Piscicoccus intestinalis]
MNREHEEIRDNQESQEHLGGSAAHGDDREQDLRLVDWGFATAAARRLTPAGPGVSPDEASAAVTALREAARRSHGYVADTTGLVTPDDIPPALVVDRATWIDINAGSFSQLLDPVLSDAIRRSSRPAPSQTAQRVGSKFTGSEVAGLLSFMSTKVLGQYELAPGRPASAARLLLVAPNVVQAERELGVDPGDFRLWVCLHEETHRVQFTAVPWLREHMLERTAALASELAPDVDTVLERLKQAVGNAPEALRSGGAGLAGLFLTPEQKEQVAQVTAVMSLLEGHADVVMDEVGPQVIRTVAHIREVFERRRDGLGMFDIVARRLLGLEAKMLQYREGAEFVRGVIDAVGMDGFNAVWTSPQTLPTPAEIADPAAWVARVHG